MLKRDKIKNYKSIKVVTIIALLLIIGCNIYSSIMFTTMSSVRSVIFSSIPYIIFAVYVLMGSNKNRVKVIALLLLSTFVIHMIIDRYYLENDGKLIMLIYIIAIICCAIRKLDKVMFTIAIAISIINVIPFNLLVDNTFFINYIIDNFGAIYLIMQIICSVAKASILLLCNFIYLQNTEPKKKKTIKVNSTQEFNIDIELAEKELELLQNKFENNEITEDEYKSIRKDIISKI